jgi:hypothetical protein
MLRYLSLVVVFTKYSVGESAARLPRLQNRKERKLPTASYLADVNPLSTNVAFK